MAIAIIGYGVFMAFQSVKGYMEDREAKKAYAKEKEEDIEVVSKSSVWVFICVTAMILATMAALWEVQNDMELLTFSAYIFIILCFFSLIGEFVVRRTILFTKNEFFYNAEAYQFHNVRDMNETNGLLGHYEIRLSTSSTKLQLPKKIGIVLKERVSAHQQKRKKRK
ncbi:MAG: hypothetical protein ACK5KR_06470 [Breznakia sp.]